MSVMMVVVHTISKKADPCICVEYRQLGTLESSGLAILERYNMVVNILSCQFDFVALISVLCYG